MTESIMQIIERWKNGDQSAAIELDARLRSELLVLVRRRRSDRLRARIDSEGVVNAAMKSFLSGVVNDEFSRLGRHVDVRRVLSCLAIRILLDQVKSNHAEKRDVGLEAGNADQFTSMVADGREPTPEECAAAIEEFEFFQNTVRDVHEKSIVILELSLEQMKPSEIAEELQLGVRTVQAIIKQMIEKWSRCKANEESKYGN